MVGIFDSISCKRFCFVSLYLNEILVVELRHTIVSTSFPIIAIYRADACGPIAAP